MTEALDAAKIRFETDLNNTYPLGEPLKTDKWIANSLLQKSIRRGEAEIAQKAALTFLAQGGSAIWRRLQIIAFEDVGAASPAVVIATVAASTDTAWRKRNGGNVRIAANVARMLAGAPKSRSAEHLITSSDQHPSLELERRLVCADTTAANLRRVADKSQSLASRALAAWRTSGIGWKGDRVADKCLPHLLDTFRQLGAPEELVSATGIAAASAREPITLMVPLVWLKATEGQARTLVSHSLPPSSYIDDVPAYALDKHTRAGRKAIRELISQNAEIRECLDHYVRRPQRNEAAYMAAFYADAAPLASELSWDGADELEALGTEADLLKSGVSSGGIWPLLWTFRENVDHLNRMRIQTVREQNRSIDIVGTEVGIAGARI